MTSPLVWEGFVLFRGYRTFYKVVGDLTQTQAGKFPVLALHGRPPSHEVLEPLEELTEAGRAVIFYDQLGCGRSDRPDVPSLWTISLFVDELDQVRRELNLGQIHLLGHSWGGVIAMEYALRQPSGIVSLILSSTFVNRAMLDADFERLREELPPEVLEILRKYEAAGTTDDPAYKQAERVFDLRHVCRVDPWPDYFDRASQHPPVGRVNTEGWDIRARLSEIRVPALITCGRFDFCTPAHAEIIHKGILSSEWVIFDESSHYAHVEETDKYLSVLKDFMTRIEQHVIVEV
jgi:proline-specific peptidase